MEHIHRSGIYSSGNFPVNRLSIKDHVGTVQEIQIYVFIIRSRRLFGISAALWLRLSYPPFNANTRVRRFAIYDLNKGARCCPRADEIKVSQKVRYRARVSRHGIVRGARRASQTIAGIEHRSRLRNEIVKRPSPSRRGGRAQSRGMRGGSMR